MAYEVSIDDFNQDQWEHHARDFLDYSIYQTWAYQQVRAENDGQEISRVIIKDGSSNAVIMCHIRIKHFKPLDLRIGYVQWGPLIRKREFEPECAVAALEKLLQIFLSNKVNILKIVPNITKDEAGIFIKDILVSSGFQHVSNVPNYHTMMLPLEGNEEELRERLHRSWRRYLKKAEESNIEIKEETGGQYFEILKKLYLLTKQRKQFKGLDPDVFIKTQELLSASEKMNIVVAHYEGQPVSAHITSHLGDTALGILATSNEVGLKCNASYLVWWRTLLASKHAGMKRYDMSGIDPVRNPKVYQFKSRMGGREAFHIGAYDACSSLHVRIIWRISERIYNLLRK